jgi:hypothetical protein
MYVLWIDTYMLYYIFIRLYCTLYILVCRFWKNCGVMLGGVDIALSVSRVGQSTCSWLSNDVLFI